MLPRLLLHLPPPPLIHIFEGMLLEGPKVEMVYPPSVQWEVHACRAIWEENTLMLYRQWTFCIKARCLHIPKEIQLKRITTKNWREFRCLEQIYIAKNGELVEKEVKAIRSTLHFWKYRSVCIQQEIHFSKRLSFHVQKPMVRSEKKLRFMSISSGMNIYILWRKEMAFFRCKPCEASNK